MALFQSMSEFTPESVTRALNALYSQAGQVQQEANNFIVRFVNSPDALPTTFSLLQSSDQESHREIAALALSKQIMTRWNQIDEQTREQIKSWLLNASTESSKLRSYINRCIVIIGIFEWPEVWPDFLISLLSARPEDPNFDNVISTLGILADEIEKSDYIVQNRRQHLRNVCLESLPEIVEILSIGIHRDTTALSCLQILCSLLKWGDLQTIISEDLMVMICGTFLQDPETMELATDCLSAVFLGQGPGRSVDILKAYFRFVVHGFVLIGEMVSDNGLLFLVRFLKIHSVELESMAFGPDPSIDRGEVMKLYEMVLLADLTELWMDDFWVLWRDVARRLRSVMTTGTGAGVVADVFMPVFEQMRQMLMGKLVKCIDEGRITDPNALGTWNLIANIDPDGFLNFVSSQEPSPALTYAIGFVEGTRDERLAGFISSYISSLWSIASSNLTEVAEPLLFVCSHYPNIIPDKGFVKNYVQLLVFCFDSSESRYHVAASHSLWHYSTKNPREVPAQEFVPLIEQIPKYASTLGSDPLVRLVKTCSRIASGVSESIPEFAQGVFPILTQAAISLFASDMAKGLLCLREIAYSADNCCYCVFENVWDPLFSLFDKYMSNPSRDVYIVELILDAIAAGLVNCEWEMVARHFQSMLELISKYPQICYLSFDAIAVCRARHMEIDGMFPAVWNLIKMADTLSTGLFHLLGELSPLLFDLKSISTLLLSGINDARNDVSYAAVVTTRTIIDTLEQEPRMIFLAEFRLPLFKVILTTMLDCLHSSIFSKECTLLLDVLLNGKMQPREQRPVQEELMEALNSVAPEPHEGFYLNFVNFLTRVADNKYKFKTCIMDFLVLMKRAAPVDSAIFFRKSKKMGRELTRELSDILDPSISFESLSEADEVPVNQVKPLRIRKRGSVTLAKPPLILLD